jgi:hypothetical protein
MWTRHLELAWRFDPRAIAQARPGLVFRVSAGFRIGDDLARFEDRRNRPAEIAREFPRDFLQGLLTKTNTIDLHRAIGRDQIESGHVRDAVLIRGGIAVVIDEGREGDAIFGAEVARITSVVLRDGPESGSIRSVGFEEALEKRKGELADRATNFEKRGDHRAAFQGLVERDSLAVEVRQFEIGRFISGVNFSHRVRAIADQWMWRVFLDM